MSLEKEDDPLEQVAVTGGEKPKNSGEKEIVSQPTMKPVCSLTQMPGSTISMNSEFEE